MTDTPDSRVARVYDRVAPLYEVGVGTGRNLEFYSLDNRLTGVDISLRMLERAARRAAGLNGQIDLRQADVEALPFPDATFDTVTATCVFCSVEDPVRGLEEVRRTEDNVRAAGLRIESVRGPGIWREIVARPGPQA